jgi:hypothetical protein
MDEKKLRRVGVLVVHGVGEQKRFEHLEEIALNLAKAAGSASVEVKYGNQVGRHAEEESWRESPVTVRWKGQKEWIEAHFREVFWADFGMPVSLSGWLRMLWWVMSMPGARVFSAGDSVGQESSDLASHHMDAPIRLPRWRLFLVRGYLWFVCSIAIPLLFFAKPIQVLLSRLISLNLPLPRVLMHTLGNVMLYQDAEVLVDRLESFNEKRRTGIRRRMVRSLIGMAAKAERDELDGFYILSHSLGTVIAFNALMESPEALPNFLSKDEWKYLPRKLKDPDVRSPVPAEQIPSRPPWLSPTDAINRQALLGKCKGFLTVGCPLDKFAALWPAIVPVNIQKLNVDIRWINVADGQDIVANCLHYFPTATGGFKLVNYWWQGEFWPITAHTSYWTVKPGRPRLMDWIVRWIEDERCAEPALPQPWRIHRLLLFLWLVLLGCIAVFLISAALTFLWITHGTHWHNLHFHSWLRLARLTTMILAGGSIILVFVSSLFRRIYEWHLWGAQFTRRPEQSLASA